MRSKLLFALIAVLSAFPPAYALDAARSLDQYSYQTWQTGSGLPQNTIHQILQSRDGYLWLATEGGLVRFDGYQFTIFDSRNTPSLKSDNVHALLEDSEGKFWIATGAGLLKRKGDKFETLAGSDPTTKNILALCRDGAGGVWAVMPDGATHWPTGGRSASFLLNEGVPRLTGAALLRDKSSLWLGTQTGLTQLKNGRFLDVQNAVPPAAVNALLLDRSARLWAGTAKGLFISGRDDPKRFSVVQTEQTGAVLSLFEDREGSVWAGTENGPIRLTENGARIEPSGHALPGASVISIAEDAEGDLWIGTESEGVTVARNQKFVTFTTRDGLADDNVRCVFEGRPGVVSVGTNSGLTQMENGHATQLTTANGLSSNVILSLGEDRAGDLLIGTPDGLNRDHDGKISVTTSADGLADDFVRSIYRDRDGSLWMGTRRGLSHEERANHFTTYTQADGLGSDLVGAIVRGREGDLWIATLNGLSRFNGKKFRTYRTADGLSSNVITALHEDAEGDLWIGTQDAGLCVLHDGKITRVAHRLGLPEAIFGIAESSGGQLWLASKAGIIRASKDELRNAGWTAGNHAPVVWYGTSDGLRISECSVGGHPEVWRAKDGTIWFSTLKGVAALYPSAARLNRVTPPVVIESVTIDDQIRSPSSIHNIRPGHARFAFDYASLNFAMPQKVLYRYKLEGFDKHWIEAGAQRTAYYTNIPPGHYRFRVLARNNDGFWNESGANLAFRLEPHFYQTFWFYALALLALGALGYLIYRWRVAEVEARFSAVLRERNRIGREIHDTLAQGFVGVSVQLEIVSRLLSSSTETAREHLDQARILVRESLSEARRSIWQLRSQSAENEDLAARLSKAATQAIGLSPVKLSLEVRGTYRPLGQAVEDELLRIGQEAVTNALRHGNPRHISIELAYASKKLGMTVSDDGRGFVASSYVPGPDGHFGLKGMRERAEQIDATLLVDSAIGKGTKVFVEAPLN